MYNKRAYNKTKVCFIEVLFYFYCSYADRLKQQIIWYSMYS